MIFLIFNQKLYRAGFQKIVRGSSKKKTAKLDILIVKSVIVINCKSVCDKYNFHIMIFEFFVFIDLKLHLILCTNHV